MLSRILGVVVLLFWLELGLVLILVPWSGIWESNYFLYEYPPFGIFMTNPFLRGAISGLGILNVLLSLGAFRRRATTVVERA